MRHRVERATCPVCKNGILKSICTGCNGDGEAVILHKPNGYEIEIYPVSEEARLRAEYPDEPTPVYERTTVHQAWELFVNMVEIRHAPYSQRREMKRAFYAGAFWMLDRLGVQLDPQGEPTADDLEYMQRIHAELIAFNEAIQEGRA